MTYGLLSASGAQDRERVGSSILFGKRTVGERSNRKEEMYLESSKCSPRNT